MSVTIALILIAGAALFAGGGIFLWGCAALGKVADARIRALSLHGRN